MESSSPQESSFLYRLDRQLGWLIHPFSPQPAYFIHPFLFLLILVEETWWAWSPFQQMGYFLFGAFNSSTNFLSWATVVLALGLYGFLFSQIIRFYFRKRLAWMTVSFMNYMRIAVSLTTILIWIYKLITNKNFHLSALFPAGLIWILWMLFHLWKMRMLNEKRICVMHHVRKKHHVISVVAACAYAILLFINWMIAQHISATR